MAAIRSHGVDVRDDEEQDGSECGEVTTKMLFDDVIGARRSIREFLPNPVPMEMVREVVDCARLSPSAKNRQPWRFDVLVGEEKEAFATLLRRQGEALKHGGICQTALVLRQAPAVIAVRTALDGMTGRTDVLSLGAAMYALCLKATDIGLGSLWVGDTDALNDVSGYEDVVGAVALGYAGRYPDARPRKMLDEVCGFPFPASLSPTEDVVGNARLSGEPYVFVSYSHADQPQVKEDVIELKRHGVPLWYDAALTGGRAWDEQAIERIAHCDCRAVLFYVSASSLASAAVLQEFLAARERQDADPSFLILPVVIGEEQPSSLLDRIENHGGMTDAYRAFFGLDDSLLYVKRDVIPQRLVHIGDVIDALAAAGVVPEERVYDDFAYKVEGGECVIIGYEGVSRSVAPPEQIAGLPVTALDESAFADNRRIERVVVPRTVRRIGAGVFRGSGVRQVEIPDTVTEFGTACFRDCDRMEAITLPPRMTRVPEAMFRGCGALRSIVVPEGVTELGEAAFRSCESMRTAVMPSTLEAMTEGGFWGCASLEELVIPRDVRGVEIQSFDTSPRLRRVEVAGFVFERGRAEHIDASSGEGVREEGA